MSSELEKTTTKQRILNCAIDLFAQRGYTETTIRELALAVGLKEASIYNHFPSKNAILEYILEEFTNVTRAGFNQINLGRLKDDPTVDGILSCMFLEYEEGKVEYYLKELYVILQEQHRNPLMGKLISEHYILGNEEVIKTIINALIENGILRSDTDPDYWAKLHSCMLYTFASRLLLGIGDQAPGYVGKNMAQMLRSTYEMLLQIHGTAQSPST
ncbi:MAG: TetR/AcrR family transcriptional regulator [Treponema sp.]|nr:TetR/AcrR family transcriptional regulator [Treponema sp.]